MRNELGLTGIAIGMAILLILLLWVATAFHPGLEVAWEFLKDGPLSGSQLSAWVQAIGSIGAILFSIWLFDSSNREKKRNSLIRARAFSSMLNTAFLGMKSGASINQTRDILLCRALMMEALEVGRGVVLESLPKECVGPVISLRSIANGVLSVADVYLLAPNSQSANTLFEVMQGFFIALSQHNLTIASVHPPVVE
ncbi:MAG: hypothetical protein LBJ15_18390 [Comamonas sp.]|jgi:hypothetical protein|uniref:hypothetical protein n=1 Tax=Comamonas sp. TaxID=34028 RepID=UPI002829F1D3|nr:hypothetical protein [Comamonas sp.]MDR0215947.1 hypothetical protein [Comamonas sp.]